LRVSSDASAQHLPIDTCRLPSDLAAVIEAWPGLAEPIRAAILALVNAALGIGAGLRPSKRNDRR
jgi:hypothetical protein